MHRVRKFMTCDSGVTLVEYGIALLLAIIVGATALTALGNDIDAQITQVSDAF